MSVGDGSDPCGVDRGLGLENAGGGDSEIVVSLVVMMFIGGVDG